MMDFFSTEALIALDGLLLVGGLIAYTVLAIVTSRKEQAGIKAEYEAEFGTGKEVQSRGNIVVNLLLVAAGLGCCSVVLILRSPFRKKKLPLLQ